MFWVKNSWPGLKYRTSMYLLFKLGINVVLTENNTKV